MLDDYLNAIKRFKEPVVYTPESPILHPWKLMTGMLRDVGKSWPLARRLIIRDLTAQYRQTIFGYLWAIIPPLATALIFIFLNSAKILAVPQTEVPYPVYVMTGTIFWQLFV
ncbi:MAG: ABC transporter permease, partial [Planctomycetota bacterium]